MIEHQLARDKAGEHYLIRLIPYQEANGTTEGVVVTIIDVTSLSEAEEHHKVLIAELNHRVRNMLTVVISIARQTMSRSPSPEDFQKALIGRLMAMARSYELLSREKWKAASIRDLAVQELTPFDMERTTIAGPDIRLMPKQSLAIGMVLHELATNAAKYGALSVPDGRVEVEWSVPPDERREEQRLDLRWRERDGPEIAKPKRRGFGLTLVEREAEYTFGGKADIDFDPHGLTVSLDLPLGD